MTLPNFIIAGFRKAGTSKLWGLLKQHPDIFLPETKEISFFSTFDAESTQAINGKVPFKGLPFSKGKFNLGINWYTNHFLLHKNESAVGEDSTIYSIDPASAQLIHDKIPKIKLIFIMRDPVQRLYSQYWQEKKWGISNKTLPDFTTIINDNHSRTDFLKLSSHYKIHLQRFFNFFPKENLLLLLTEDLRQNPEHTLKLICKFLNINTHFKFDTKIQSQSQHKVHPYPGIQLLKNTYLRNMLIFWKLPEKYRRMIITVKRKLFKLLKLEASISTYRPINSPATHPGVSRRY